MASLHEQMRQSASVPVLQSWFGADVCISRGPLTSEAFKARRLDVSQTGFNSAGIEIESTTRKYILAVADVVIDGDRVEPEPGDLITEGDQVYEVLPDDQRPVVLLAGRFEYEVMTKRNR